MIHSMSGGVLSEYGVYTFVKVMFDDSPNPYWYVTDFDVKEGDKVLAPFGVSGLGKQGTVIKIEEGVSGQVAPIPIKRVKRLLNKL